MASTWTDQQIADNLTRSGLHWSGTSITYAFPQVTPAWASSMTEGQSFSGFSAAQMAVAREVMGLWDDLMAVDVAETSGASDVKFCNTTTGVSYAQAYFPGSSGAAGSVWLNATYDASTGINDLMTPVRGKWGYVTYMHEVGHALGLSHPGDYSGSVTYGNDAPYAQDTVMYTVMSYFGASNTGADWTASDGHGYEPQTPMVHDILAIQQVYGADLSTRAGNTVYGFHANAGRDVYDFTVNSHPIVAIWDGGGKDTLDLSGFATASRIDLAPGAFSDCDAMTFNLAIAIGCHIENAVGGAASDRIRGNALANLLTGNGGDDTLAGRGGNDTLRGGTGADFLNGDAGNDRLFGGAGNDVVRGGGGGDLIRGGEGLDRLAGGSGADRFWFATTGEMQGPAGSDRITDFVRGVDMVDLSDAVATASAAGGSGPLLGFVEQNGNTICSLDVDGDGTVDAHLVFLRVSGLAAVDFIL